MRILKTLGFGEAKIRRVLTQRYEEHDNNFYNFEDFQKQEKLWKKKENVKDARNKKGMWSLNRVNIWVFVFDVANFSLDVTSVT